MKKLHCPQCDIQRFFVKNSLNDSIVVTVNELYEVIPIHPTESIVGFDLTMLYCLGCSWQGSPQSLRSGKVIHEPIKI